ncbi:MAG: GspH/FimT family pseudopilin [Pseudomonadales bacterium]
MTNKSTDNGFTIVELMVSLAIAAILMGYALPAFNDFLTQRTMTTRVNEFVAAVNYARSEAARLGGQVTVQAVDAGDSANEWGAGYCVVAGNPGDCDPPVLRMFEGSDNVTFNATGGLNNLDRLRFNARGMLVVAVAGTVEICSTDAEVDPGRQVTLTLMGRPDASELVCNP